MYHKNEERRDLEYHFEKVCYQDLYQLMIIRNLIMITTEFQK